VVQFAGLDESNPSLLARLLGLDGEPSSVWESEELQGLLNHLLTMPLGEALPGIQFSSVSGPPPTLSGLFTDPSPPLALLQSVKEWSRRLTRSIDPPLPTDVVSLFYFASIVTGHLRHDQWISKLDPAMIDQGIAMLVVQPWVGEPFQSLFREFNG
jgi:hypothetical protein